MSNNSSAFLSYLEGLMHRMGKKPGQLARDLNVSHAAVSRWLSGKDIPNVRSCIKLAEYGGISAEILLAMVNHLPKTRKPSSSEWPEFREYAYHKYPDELDEDMITMIEVLIQRRKKRRDKSEGSK